METIICQGIGLIVLVFFVCVLIDLTMKAIKIKHKEFTLLLGGMTIVVTFLLIVSIISVFSGVN